jgi:hypothetical protein
MIFEPAMRSSLHNPSRAGWQESRKNGHKGRKSHILGLTAAFIPHDSGDAHGREKQSGNGVRKAALFDVGLGRK